MSTGTLALLIFAAIFAQAMLLLLLSVRRRRQGKEGGPPTVARAVKGAASVPVHAAGTLAWEGYREFKVVRKVVENTNRSVCSFYLEPVDGAPLPPFLPGQYLTFRVPVGSDGGGEKDEVIRCYSLSDRPRPDRYRISVKRVPAPAGHPELPPGRSSGFLHDRVEVGSLLSARAPAGHFYLREDEPLPVVLLAGGIGITPLLSMLNHLLEGGSERQVWLFYGVSDGDDQIMGTHLRELAARHANFHLHLCFSNPGQGDEEGVDYQHHGRVDIPLLRTTLPFARHQFYVCGPPAMMESLVPGLEEWGIAPEDIHYEAFGPASISRRKPVVAMEGGAVPKLTVTFDRTGRSEPWNPDAGSLLEFAESLGIDLESGCRAGSCGTCQTRIVSGEVAYNQDPDAEIAPGHCLPCICIPTGNLSLSL